MLAPEKFKEILRNTPLIAIDLLILDNTGRALLGLRNNEPGKGFWSVPGGRIFKDETLKEAFKRISFNEVGFITETENIRFRGVYEHFYNENFFLEKDIKTHYVTIACEIVIPNDKSIPINSQHNKFDFFEIKELLESPVVLENTKRFFNGEPDDLFS